jgi:hypothetical protein
MRNDIQHKYIQDAELRRKTQQQSGTAATAAAAAGGGSSARQQLLLDLGLAGESLNDQQQQQQEVPLLGPHRQKIRSRFWRTSGGLAAPLPAAAQALVAAGGYPLLPRLWGRELGTRTPKNQAELRERVRTAAIQYVYKEELQVGGVLGCILAKVLPCLWATVVWAGVWAAAIQYVYEEELQVGD